MLNWHSVAVCSDGEASANPTSKKETVRTVVTDEQRAEVFAAAFGWCVATDDELLLLGQFDFDPGTASPLWYRDSGLFAIKPSSWNCRATWRCSSLLPRSSWENRILSGAFSSNLAIASLDKRSRAQIGSV